MLSAHFFFHKSDPFSENVYFSPPPPPRLNSDPIQIIGDT